MHPTTEKNNQGPYNTSRIFLRPQKALYRPQEALGGPLLTKIKIDNDQQQLHNKLDLDLIVQNEIQSQTQPQAITMGGWPKTAPHPYSLVIGFGSRFLSFWAGRSTH